LFRNVITLINVAIHVGKYQSFAPQQLPTLAHTALPGTWWYAPIYNASNLWIKISYKFRYIQKNFAVELTWCEDRNQKLASRGRLFIGVARGDQGCHASSNF